MFNQKAVFSLFVSLLSLAYIPVAFAEGPSEIGRLEDGRAYRTDNNGYQIVDQVAELEVSSDDLRRQVLLLEDELAQKNRIIKKLGGAELLVEDSVSEKTLMSSGLPRAKSEVGQEPDCNRLVSALERKVSSLEVQSKSDTERYQRLVANLESRVNELSTQPQLASKPELPTSTKTKARARLQREVVDPKVYSKQLSRIQKKVSRRKSYLDRVARSGKGLKLSASPLVTQRGHSLDQLRQSISEKGPLSKNRIQSGLTQIESILDEDIKTAKRVSG